MLPDLKIWLNHFEYHSGRSRHVPAHIADTLTCAERCLIAPSVMHLEQTQLAAAQTLLHAAYVFSQQRRMPGLARITELLVRESGQHATMLAHFRTRHGIPPAGSGGPGVILRSAAPLAVLGQHLSRQFCHLVCYRALESATSSQHLRLLCRMLVADGRAHVGFLSDVLHGVRSEQVPWRRATGTCATTLQSVTIAADCWLTHRAVLSRAGFGPMGYLRACREQYAFYMEPVRLGAAAER
jgi:hypothetical protein